jgi:hypothetical protein
MQHFLSSSNGTDLDLISRDLSGFAKPLRSIPGGRPGRIWRLRLEPMGHHRLRERTTPAKITRKRVNGNFAQRQR